MITLKVTPDDGAPYTVTATARDVLAWEKVTANRSFVDLMNEPTLVDLYRVAHLACRRQGLFTGTQKEFEDSCEVTGGVEDDEEPDPTQSGASPESASASPSEPASPPTSGRRKVSGQ